MCEKEGFKMKKICEKEGFKMKKIENCNKFGLLVYEISSYWQMKAHHSCFMV